MACFFLVSIIVIKGSGFLCRQMLIFIVIRGNAVVEMYITLRISMLTLLYFLFRISEKCRRDIFFEKRAKLK